MKSIEERKRQGQQYYQENKEKIKQRTKKYHQEIKSKVLSYYSNGEFKCACCGESHREFLTLDHINGNGAEQRKNLGFKNVVQIYFWIIRNNYPKGFQVLCWNCNCGKHHYGICPHNKV